jgi:hypothetical protein
MFRMAPHVGRSLPIDGESGHVVYPGWNGPVFISSGITLRCKARPVDVRMYARAYNLCGGKRESVRNTFAVNSSGRVASATRIRTLMLKTRSRPPHDPTYKKAHRAVLRNSPGYIHVAENIQVRNRDSMRGAPESTHETHTSHEELGVREALAKVEHRDLLVVARAASLARQHPFPPSQAGART